MALPDSPASDVELPRPLTLAVHALSVVAGLLLLALIALTIADVVGRNAGGRSIVGTVDISTMLLVAIAFLGLAAAEINGNHVTVELVETRFGPTTRLVLSVLRAVLLVALGVLIIWGLGEVLVSALERGETTNDILRLPTWPAKVVLFLSFVAFFVVAVWKELLTFRALRSEANGAQR